MSKDFKVDPKLWDDLSEEQKTLLNATLAQHENVVKKDNEVNEGELKKKWEEEQLASQKTKKENDDFIQTVKGEDNQKLVQDLLKIKTKDEIKESYPSLFEENKAEKITDAEVNSKLNDLLTNFQNGTSPSSSDKVESDAAFLERMNKEGTRDEKELIRFQEIKQKEKIK